MSTLWLQFGNTALAHQRFQVPRLDYPLAFNLPGSSWREEPSALKLRHSGRCYELHVDVVLELAKDLNADTLDVDASHIAGFRLCAGLFDKSFVEGLSQPSARDRGVCDYYARWPDASNALGPLWKMSWEQIHRQPLALALPAGRQQCRMETDLDPLTMLKFFRPFNQFCAGDRLSLGTFLVAESPVCGKVRLELGEHHWFLEIASAASS